MSVLPCPHCGKTAEDFDPDTREHAIVGTCYSKNHACVVQCNSCGLSGPIEDSIPQAVEAWNSLPRRAE